MKTKKNKQTILKVPLLVLGFLVLFSFGISAVAAADTPDSGLVNGTAATDTLPTVNEVTTTSTSGTPTTTSDTSTTTSDTSTTTTDTPTNLTSDSTTTLPDPTIQRTGVHYATILSAVSAAIDGDTITLEPGTYYEHDIIIDKNLTLIGHDQTDTIIDAQNLGRIFTISPNKTLSIQNLTLQNGRSDNGGAIYNGGTLAVTDTTLTGTTAPHNGGILTVINCTFLDNTATYNGGAIYNGGTITITNSTLTSNTATYNGGTLTATNCTFTGNSAQNGGAIYNGGTLNLTTSILTSNTATYNGGTLTITYSTFTDNTATQNGGAICNDATLTVTSSTLTDNTATMNGGTLTVSTSKFMSNVAQNGGAISNGSTLTVTNSTLTRNTAHNGGTLTATNNIFMGNSATQNGGAIYNDATLTATNNTLTDNTVTHNGGAVTETNNTFLGNTALNGRAIYNNTTLTDINNVLTRNTVQNGVTVNATHNWWGSNADPSSNVYGPVNVTPWLDLTLVLTKTASNSSPNVGQQFYYTLITTNNGPDTTTGVLVTDIIPAGLTFNSYTATQGTYCSATGIWNTGTLVNGASAIIQLFVTPTASAAGTTVTNTVTIPGQTASAIVVVPRAPVTGLVLTKTASNLVPNVGQQFNYTIIVVNNGPDTATGVQMTDVIPAGLTFDSYSATQGTYNSATGVWDVGTLANGASATLQLFVTPTASLAGTTVTNSATIPGQIASATVVVPATPVSNVVLTKTASNVAPNVGQQFNYTLIMTNNGPNTATGVQMTDVIPAGLTFDSYSATQGTYNSATGVWSVGTLANGASATLQLFVTPTASLAGTTVINSATIPGQIASATVVVPATPVSNVVLTKTASNSSPNVGQQFNYTLTATNNGPDTATGVLVTDVIPAGLTFNGYTATQGTYNSATGVWNVGTLANGASATLQLFVTPTASVAGTTIINSATIPGQIASATVHIGSVVPVTPHQANVNAKKVPMQSTGAPILPLLLGALLMIAGFVNNTRKN